MANDIESFDWKANMARVNAGFKGGPFFKDPQVAPAITVSDPTPPTVDEKLMDSGKSPQPAVQDPFVYRYPNAKL